MKTLAKYNFRIAYKKGKENARADALSRRLDFISKTDKRKALLKEGKNSLEYSSEIAMVYKVVEDPLIKQRIKNVYKGDTRAQCALTNKHEFFYTDELGLIRFKGIVYLLKSIKK